MNKEILRLAIPNILSNISIPLLSTVDTLLMGQTSTLHLGAIGIASMLFNMIYWNFGFLRMGTTGQIAQAFGADDHPSIGLGLIRGIILALILSTFLIIFRYQFFTLARVILSVSDDHLPLIVEYFDIRIFAAPASFCLFVLLGWFFGMQNAWIPLLITIAINVINIIISAYLVNHADMGIAGAAWGTVIAQYSGLIMSVAFLFRYEISKYLFKRTALYDWAQLKQYFSVNSNLFIRTVLLTTSFAFFYRVSSVAGANILAANVILLQLLNWMSYGIDGFGYAAESIVGKYQGAKDTKNMSKAIKAIFIWGLVISVSCSIVYGLTGERIIKLFSDDPVIQQLSIDYLPWMIIIPSIAFASYIWDGIFIGLLSSREMRDTMLLSFVLYIASYFLLIMLMDQNNALWLAMLLFLLFRGLFQTWWWIKYIKPKY